MNCKPGDLAVVIRCRNGGVAKVGSLVIVKRRGPRVAGEDTWHTSPCSNGRTWFFDSSLRPIRDQPGKDETLAWKPLPMPQIEGQPA